MSSPNLEKRLSALEKVLQITRDMAASSDLEELLGVIIDRSMELLEAERATLFLYDPDRQELFSKIAAGADEIRFPANIGIAGAAVRDKKVINIPDAYADERFNPEIDRRTGFRTRSILAVPLLDYSGQIVGVLEVINKKDDNTGQFNQDDIVLAETLAAQAGVVLQQARLMEHYIQKQRMEQALQIAREIQQGLLPNQDPVVEGFDIAGWSAPADEAGGDVYDFFDLGDGRLTIMLADATGHGVGPALVAAEARAMMRALCCQGVNLSAIISKVNDLLEEDLAQSRFVTCFFGLLDAGKKTISYISAGQGPLLFYEHRSDRFERMLSTGLPLGVIGGTNFDQKVQRRLEKGDIFAITTDGFFEACNKSGEMFGMERIEQVVRRYKDLPARDIINHLCQELFEFIEHTRQDDDLTAIIIRRTS